MGTNTATLKQLTLKASVWTVSQFFIVNLNRLAANIIITRILAPELFGLMQLVFIFTLGMNFISDLGVHTNIIQNKRGDEPIFLRTAWTFQVIKGIVFWIASLLIAEPFASLYDQPSLRIIIPVACLSMIITGFKSTNIFVYQKHLQHRIVSIITIVGSIVSTLVMILLAWIFESVWALVSAGITNATVITILSHYVSGPKMQFKFDKEIFIDILHFGKWIILSSLLTFLAAQLDRIYIGLTVSIELLAFYGIAATLALAGKQLVNMYGFSILLPFYRKLLDLPQHIAKSKIKKMRYIIFLLIFPPLFVLAIWGQQICDFIYPENYAEVGVILKILALGTAASIIPLTLIPFFFAAGAPYKSSIILSCKIVAQLIAMQLGYLYIGFLGILYGIAFIDILIYPVTILLILKHKIWTPDLDFACFAICGLIGIYGGVFP